MKSVQRLSKKKHKKNQKALAYLRKATDQCKQTEKLNN